MVWENGCVVLVMLAPLAENGVRQCYHYWPDEGSNLYHVYEVPAAGPQGRTLRLGPHRGQPLGQESPEVSDTQASNRLCPGTQTLGLGDWNWTGP